MRRSKKDVAWNADYLGTLHRHLVGGRCKTNRTRACGVAVEAPFDFDFRFGFHALVVLFAMVLRGGPLVDKPQHLLKKVGHVGV